MTTLKTLTALTILLTLTACDSSQRARLDAERAEKQYQDALSKYKAGDVKGAEEGFRAAVKDNPANASAHFQLAVLLQNDKDYLGAMSHFETYRQLAPGSDKAPLAGERMKMCEPLLVEKYAQEYGLPTRSELEALQDRYDRATNDLAQAEAGLRAAQDEARDLRAKLDRAQTASVRPVAVPARPADGAAPAPIRPVTPPPAETAPERPRLALTRPDSSSEGTAQGLAEARRLVEAARQEARDENPSAGPVVVGAAEPVARELPEIRGVAFQPMTSERPPKPVRKTHVVQKGDTLWSIAREHYPELSNQKAADLIYEANKLKMPRRRVRAGDVLILP